MQASVLHFRDESVTLTRLLARGVGRDPATLRNLTRGQWWVPTIPANSVAQFCLGPTYLVLNISLFTMKRSGSADALTKVPDALNAPATPQHDSLVEFALNDVEDQNLREWRRWQFNLVAYTIMTILGIGVLLPWNVAINACVQM